MTLSTDQRPPRIRDRLAGQQILVTGATGFLAKVFVEKLLRSVDTVGGIHLLVRSRPGGATPQQRVWKDLLRSRAFDRLRASLGDGFDDLCREKIHVVGGDLAQKRLGLDACEYDELAERISLIINSAATVTFDEQINLAIQLNSLGPGRLLQLARDSGDVPFLHVSTCYVCGVRHGEVVEDFSAPETAREKLPRVAPDGRFDLDRLIQDGMEESLRIKQESGVGTERTRRALIDAGMNMARRYGWNDTYTFTKWIGEQLLVRDHGDVPVAILRPAIIEGSYDEPAPGWIDGLRMADPIIVAYGKGKLNEFPALGDVPLDLIPVDFVANAMFATLPTGDDDTTLTPVYHCASSGRNPMVVREVVSHFEEAFRKCPMTGDDGQPIRVKNLHFVDHDRFVLLWRRRLRRLLRAKKFLEFMGWKGRRHRRLSVAQRQIDQVLYFAKIYSPYTHLDCRFVDDSLRAVHDAMSIEDRALFPFDVERIDWRDYVVHRHIPGLRSFVLGTGSEPTGRIRAVEDKGHRRDDQAPEPLAADNLFDMFARAVKRFADEPALQIRRSGRWIRYTYDEAYDATGSIMRRLQERGTNPGDRVAIMGDSNPEWGLTYLAIMRAGMTAVPLDPQLSPAETLGAIRFVGAKLLCVAPSLMPHLQRAGIPSDVPVVTMSEPFVPPPGASRDASPDPQPAPGSSIASILFTSGTTLAPKAVPLTHRNLMANAQALMQVHRVYASDELLSVLPMYHAFEFTGGFLVPLACGATITYVEEMKGQEIRSAMQATRTTVMLVVPRLLQRFNASIENEVARSGFMRRVAFRGLGVVADLSGRRLSRVLFSKVHQSFGGRLRMFVSGGSRLDPGLCESFERMGFAVYEGYGLTETAPVIAVNPPSGNRPGSVGKILPNLELDIANANVEGIGEVWVRGPSVMEGYLDNPDATSEVMRDDWLATGDLGRIDKDGYLYLTGRTKDLIVTGAGKNVYPDEVELLYAELPFVSEFCVFGMEASDGVGDETHAVAVLDAAAASGSDRSSVEREIRAAAASISDALPSHQRIRALHIWDRELPRTSTLKAKRGCIRDLVRGEKPPVLQSAKGSAARAEGISIGGLKGSPTTRNAIRKILATHTQRRADLIKVDDHILLDLGIDSIGKIDVLGDVEAKFGMLIDDEKASSITRVADLFAVVGNRVPIPGGKRDGSMWRKRLAGEAAGPVENGKVSAPLLPVRWVVRGGMNAFLSSYVRVRAKGRENIPLNGAFILAPNHASHLDSPSVLAAIGGQRRVWVAGAEDYFFDTRWKRLLFGKILDTIAVDRHADGISGLRRCGDALDRGDGLLIFPEGTRSTTGHLQPFKIGVAVLAIERQVPIIPVSIQRSFELFPKGARWVKPGTVTVVFGAPVVPPTLAEETDHYEEFRKMTERVRASVSSLRPGAFA